MGGIDQRVVLGTDPGSGGNRAQAVIREMIGDLGDQAQERIAGCHIVASQPLLYGDVYRGAGLMAWLLKDPETAISYYQQALALFTNAGDARRMMYVLNGLGCVALEKQAEDAARQYFLQSLQMAELTVDSSMAATLYGNLGYVAMRRRDWRAAEEHMQSCLVIHREQQLHDAWPLQNLGALAQARGQWAQSIAFFEQSLQQYRRLGETYRIAEVLEQLAEVLEQYGDPREADRCRQESQALYVHLRSS